MLPAVLEFADEYRAFVERADFWAELRRGSLASLERWDDASEGGSLGTQSEATTFRDRAARLQEGASLVDRSLLGTIEATADLLRLILATLYELTIPNPEVGLLANLLPFLPRQPLVTADDGDRYLEKLERFPAFATQMGDRLASGAAQGRTVLRRHAASTAEALAALIDDLSPLLRQSAPEEGYEGWEAALSDQVGGPVVEGLRAYHRALADHAIPAGRDDDEPGLSFWPGGGELYAQLVAANCNLPVTPEEVHRIGLEQIDRLEAEYREVAGPVFGTTTIGEIYEQIRGDDRHYGTVDALISDAEACLERGREAAPAWFERWPETDCVAVPITTGALAFYTLQPNQPGMFFFNVANPEIWTVPFLENTAFHEAIPGHHFQRALADEDPDLHYVQKKMYIAAYNEGWGLYSERLSDEMGLFSSDYARLGMLLGDSMRAFRLVADTGLHAFGWSRQQAITYGMAHSPLAEAAIVAEVDRYLGTPAQALGYMMGRLEIDRIRADAEARLGDRFDIKGFHEAVLGAGTVTLAVLAERVGRWIEHAE